MGKYNGPKDCTKEAQTNCPSENGQTRGEATCYGRGAVRYVALERLSAHYYLRSQTMSPSWNRTERLSPSRR